MGFRLIVLTEKSEISTLQNYLVVQSEDEVKKVHLSEVDVLIIENVKIRISVNLMNLLAKEKIVTIICDETHLPSIYLLPLYNHHRRAQNIKKQVSWTKEQKDIVWQKIIRDKIYNQQMLLKILKESEPLLNDYEGTVQIGDATNREAMAAKVYFDRLFGTDFARHAENSTNWALNYGYAILLSYVTRTITAKGYLTELGIHHMNEYNPYNLSCDIMEPFRPIVDYIVSTKIEGDFSVECRRFLQEMHNMKVLIDGKKYFLSTAIEIYTQEILQSLDTDGDYPTVEIDITSVKEYEF